MKSIKRKLSLRSQTLRHLTRDELGGIYGGISSDMANMCSTVEDTGCLPSGNDYCASDRCPTVAYGCTTNYP
jgi:hypothetical protein